MMVACAQCPMRLSPCSDCDLKIWAGGVAGLPNRDVAAGVLRSGLPWRAWLGVATRNYDTALPQHLYCCY